MMKTAALLAAAAALSSCAMSGDAPDAAAREAPGEVMLSEALAGRTEGEARNCVRQQDIRNARSAGGNTILFDGPGGIVYVNRASGSCPPITARDAIRHRTINTAICSGELIRIYDPQTGVEKGGCSLGAFVPWRRAG
jgi:hypothetical protein